MSEGPALRGAPNDAPEPSATRAMESTEGQKPPSRGRALRILYAGTLDPGGTCLQRMKVLQELGHSVVPLDVDPFVSSGSRIVRSLRLRLSAGPGVGALNRELLRLAQASAPDILWVDKGLYLRPESLRQVRRPGTLLVHYNPDDPFGAYRRGWRNFLRAIAEYDVHLVPRDVNVSEYTAAGARHVIRFHWAFDPATHHPLPVSEADRERLGGLVGFIGDWEPDRERSIRAVAAGGFDVRVWGTNWGKCRDPHPRMRIENRPLWAREYALGICAFDINLGFLRKGNRDLSTTRSVEIPACAAFLLAERTSEHQALFAEGREAEFFGSDQELLEKVGWYAQHPEDRRRIAEAGHRRCLEGGYSNQERLSALVARITSAPLDAAVGTRRGGGPA